MSPRAKATLLVGVLFYGALLAFGPAVLGLPAVVAVALAVSVLFVPVPWFVWHAMAVVLRGRDLGFSPGRTGVLLALLTVGRHAPELRRSQRIALGGLGYGVALIAAWILYASTHGL